MGFCFAYELPPAAVFRATLLKTLLELLPSVVIAVMHTTTIKASMTAYSTAVGPSSAFRNCTSLLCHTFFIDHPLSRRFGLLCERQPAQPPQGPHCKRP